MEIISVCFLPPKTSKLSVTDDIYRPLFYKLKKGETLISLSKKWLLPVETIRNANTGITFFEGITVKLPCVYGKVYVVKPFDTLSKIAANNNLEVSEIKEKNQIEYIYVGQILLLE